jgi:EAL domain-containing protein (putative c-di-GMP-specific phosphodiesterase class I)
MAAEPKQGGKQTITVPVAVAPDDVRAILREPSLLALVAQPIVDLVRGEIVGYEVLSRFTLPGGRPGFPDKVFAAASLSGLGPELEALVIGRAFELADTKPESCFITINIDPHHIEEPQVAAVIDRRAQLSGIVFELTEHTHIADLRAVRKAVDALRHRGAKVALDDAGAGYSGLKQLLELQPQVLKIDRDLVNDLHKNEAKRAMIQMLGELASRLDAWVLAEGIENESELAALLQLGITYGQGYFLGRPAPPFAVLAEDPSSALVRSGRHRKLPGSALRVSDALEPAMVCKGTTDWPAQAKVAIRVDAMHRPIEMRLSGEDGPRLRLDHDLMRVKADASIAATATRALTRHERVRWDPLVCVDDAGRLEGVVLMQRLVAALATHVASES